MDRKKIKAIEEWSLSKNVSKLRSFLDLALYYHRFVKGLMVSLRYRLNRGASCSRCLPLPSSRSRLTEPGLNTGVVLTDQPLTPVNRWTAIRPKSIDDEI